LTRHIPLGARSSKLQFQTTLSTKRRHASKVKASRWTLATRQKDNRKARSYMFTKKTRSSRSVRRAQDYKRRVQGV